MSWTDDRIDTLQTLAPVGIAALTGALVVRGLVGSTPIFVVWHEINISSASPAAAAWSATRRWRSAGWAPANRRRRNDAH